jgi:hypothetical protein
LGILGKVNGGGEDVEGAGELMGIGRCRGGRGVDGNRKMSRGELVSIRSSIMNFSDYIIKIYSI